MMLSYVVYNVALTILWNEMKLAFTCLFGLNITSFGLLIASVVNRFLMEWWVFVLLNTFVCPTVVISAEFILD
jgi:hypothetical protein